MFPIVYLKCGGFVSIQASAMHYCTPRADHGPWTEGEIGFPVDCPQSALDILEMGEDHIAAYVPTEVVRAFIEACGGLARPVDHPVLEGSPCFKG